MRVLDADVALPEVVVALPDGIRILPARDLMYVQCIKMSGMIFRGEGQVPAERPSWQLTESQKAAAAIGAAADAAEAEAEMKEQAAVMAAAQAARAAQKGQKGGTRSRRRRRSSRSRRRSSRSRRHSSRRN